MDEQQRFKQLQQQIQDNGQIMFAGRLLERAAQKFPNRTALICGDRTLTFAQLFAQAVRLSVRLQELGVKPGDHGALLFGNSAEFYIGYYALWQVGAVVMPLNTFLRAGELKNIFDEAQPAVLIAQPDLPVVPELLKQVQVPHVITDLACDADASADAPQFTIPARDTTDLAVLLYTSGTTGMPKGVMLSSKNILVNLAQGLARFDTTPDDRILAVLPLFHAFAQNTCVWGPVFVGTLVIVVPKIERRHISQGLRLKPTLVFGVPALYGLFCLLKTLPFEQVRYFISGGDAMPDKIRTTFALLYRRRICNGYGLTECAPVVAVHMEEDFTATECVGEPLIGIECAIRDEEGNAVPTGEIGILWVRGDNVMQGYYQAPEATADVLQDGWFCTGDFARIDRRGRLSICGRHKDLIIHKGLNVYPQEIENMLISHAAVMRAAVIGIRDGGADEVPIAFVALRDGEQYDPEVLSQELQELCRRNLAAYKVPRAITVLDDMPLTATGKVDKKELRARHGSAT